MKPLDKRVKGIASSYLLRFIWCPDSKVELFGVLLGNLKKAEHRVKMTISATKVEKDKTNHWLLLDIQLKKIHSSKRNTTIYQNLYIIWV